MKKRIFIIPPIWFLLILVYALINLGRSQTNAKYDKIRTILNEYPQNSNIVSYGDGCLVICDNIKKITKEYKYSSIEIIYVEDDFILYFENYKGFNKVYKISNELTEFLFSSSQFWEIGYNNSFITWIIKNDKEYVYYSYDIFTYELTQINKEIYDEINYPLNSVLIDGSMITKGEIRRKIIKDRFIEDEIYSKINEVRPLNVYLDITYYKDDICYIILSFYDIQLVYSYNIRFDKIKYLSWFHHIYEPKIYEISSDADCFLYKFITDKELNK